MYSDKVYDINDPEYYDRTLVEYQRAHLNKGSHHQNGEEEKKKILTLRKLTHYTPVITGAEIKGILQKLFLSDTSRNQVLMEAVISTICSLKGTKGKKRVEKKVRQTLSGINGMSTMKIDGKEWIVWQ